MEFLDIPIFFCNVPELSRVSRKNFQVSRFLEKSPDSRNNFGFLPKQRLFELSAPVDHVDVDVHSLLKNCSIKRVDNDQITEYRSTRLRANSPTCELAYIGEFTSIPIECIVETFSKLY